MVLHRLFRYFIVWITFAIAPTAWGDRLVFTNGDELTGDFISHIDGLVVFESELLGRMEIDNRLIEEIITSSEEVEEPEVAENIPSDGPVALPPDLLPVVEEPEVVAEEIIVVEPEPGDPEETQPERDFVTIIPDEATIDGWIRRLVSFVPSPVYERLRLWDSQLTIGYTRDSGTTDRQRLETRLKTNYEGDTVDVRLEGSYRYGQRRNDDGENETDLDRYRLEARGRYAFAENIFVQSLTRYSGDQIRSISDEFSQSVGIGWQFLDNGRTSASVTPSLSSRYREINAESQGWETLTTLFQDLDHRFTERLRFEQEAQISVDPTNGGEATFDFSAELRAGWTEYLISTLRYEVRYDAELDGDDRQTDRTLSFNFGVEF